MHKYLMLPVKVPFILLFFYLVIYYSPVFGQTKMGDRNWTDNVFTGGAFGFQFGSYSTLIDLSPTIGYYLTDNLAIGTGISYKYYKLEDLYMINLSGGEIRTYDHVANIIGSGLFLRYYFHSEDMAILNNLFGHLEYEFLKYKFNEYRPNDSYTDVLKSKQSYDISSYFVGGGYRQFIGDRSFMYLMALWNLNETIYSPYDNPVIRIGLNFGL